MRTAAPIILLTFDEPEGVQPSDRIGSLKDLGGEAGLAEPVIVEGWAGSARDFTPATTHGYLTEDNDTGATLLNRDLTIQAILSVDLSADAGAMTVICRGTDGSAAEYYTFGLELQEQVGNAGFLEVRLFHATAAGVVKTQLPGTFQHPGDNQLFLLTATRRWESSSKVVCRYYVNDRMIAEVSSADGDVGGGTTGKTSIGARKTGGAWGRFYSGAIDELYVASYEMSGEEVEATWLRLTKHQPEGVERFRALCPPGAPWSKNPDSRIGKLVKTAGQALGFATAKADELLRNFLPDRAYHETIARWEKLCGLAPKAFDSLDVRRDRVVAFLSRDNGYSVPLITALLETPFALAAADIEVLEFSPTITDAFATLEAERWFAEPAAVWSIAANALRLNVAAAANIGWGISNNSPTMNRCHVLMPISDGHQVGGNGACIQQVKIASLAAIPADASIVGIFLHDPITRDALWFGLFKTGANHLVGYKIFKNGALAARVQLADLGAVFAPIFLRLTANATVAGTFTFEWGTTSFTAGMTASTVAGLITGAQETGLAALGDDASLAGGIDLTFDDYTARFPRGDRAFKWYAYRDPALANFALADIIGANLALRRLRPAHTHGAAITSTSLLCDNPASLCDRGPLGGL